MILSNGFSFSSYIVAACCFTLAFYLLKVAGYWNIFGNAGESRWKALVPLLRKYTQYRISWRTANFWIALVFVGAGCAVLVGFCPAMLSSWGNVADMMASLRSGIPGTYIGIAFLAGGYAVNACSLWYLGKSFDQGWGFAAVALFFPTFARLGLGLSPVCYRGNVALAR